VPLPETIKAWGFLRPFEPRAFGLGRNPAFKVLSDGPGSTVGRVPNPFARQPTPCRIQAEPPHSCY